MRYIAIVLFILAVIAQNILWEHQTRNIDKVSPEELYEIALIKNGVRNGK